MSPGSRRGPGSVRVCTLRLTYGRQLILATVLALMALALLVYHVGALSPGQPDVVPARVPKTGDCPEDTCAAHAQRFQGESWSPTEKDCPAGRQVSR